MQDINGDGQADVTARFGDTIQKGDHGGTGIALYKDALYAETNDRIVRYGLPKDGIMPTGAPETIVSGLPLTGDHPMHPFAIDAKGNLFIDVASATNSCQAQNRMPNVSGDKPCTELETRAGIWRYDANKTDQKFSTTERYATGIRNADGIAMDSTGLGLYAAQQGRDELYENWPKLYNEDQGANLPAEELLQVAQGDDFGWPECYFDNDQQKLVLAPEYGGDGGKTVGVCAQKKGPVAFFPAHWAPNDLMLYNGTQFPSAYNGGAFIAFHDSWNRAPLPLTMSCSNRLPTVRRRESISCLPMVSPEVIWIRAKPRIGLPEWPAVPMAGFISPTTSTAASGGSHLMARRQLASSPRRLRRRAHRLRHPVAQPRRSLRKGSIRMPALPRALCRRHLAKRKSRSP